MMPRRVLLFAIACCLAQGTSAFGQGNTMGTLSGKVVDPDGLAMPGVTITATSPTLQGVRTIVSSPNGDFVLPLLPAGDYKITFELSGFGTQTLEQRVSPGETRVLAAVKLALATVSETVNVVGKVENFAQTASSSVSYKSDFVQKLPTDRSLIQTVQLAPGVNNTGPSGSTTISGALSYEGLYLLNGVVINENLRGQPLGLFVEDAIQETTTTTGSVSAEYGRFAGGVVNTITKSGGNRFSGSFRMNLANDSWRSATPYGEPKTDKTVPTYTYTFGGPVLKDKLWFFHDGRYTKTATSGTFAYSSLPYDQTTKEYRLEEKLTYAIAPNHTIRGTAFNLATSAHNYWFSGMDPRLMYDRRLPQNMYSLNYNGIISSKFFFEVQYSQRHLAWENDGSRYTDRIYGTQLSDRTQTVFWSPTFCGVCTGESRDNKDILAKGNYFLSTSKVGSHNMVFGADVFKDYRYSNNHQSGSDFIVSVARSIRDGSDFYPVFNNTTASSQTIISYRPILVPTKGTNIWTYSGFFNDSWRFNNNLSFNLGLRWDRNRSIDSSGAEVARDATFSPRLSMTWDPKGDGKTTIFGSYARYVAAMANSIADAGSAGGQPALYQWYYAGQTVNTGSAPYLSPDKALPILFAWWDAQGGASNPNLVAVTIPGLSTRIGEDLKAQYMTEYMAGMSHNFGRVLVRVDASYRPASNFYGNFTSMATGKATNPVSGAKYDLTLVQNTASVWRRYWGVNSQVSWRVKANLNVGANWTISENRGTVEGENAGSGPIRAAADAYPEYKDRSWNYPEGDLNSDQRHRGRIFGNYDMSLGRFGRLGFGVLEMINSGSPWGAVGSIDMRPYVANPGYSTAQGGSTVTYYFAARDAYRGAWNIRTDVSINYSYRVGRVEAFWQGQVLNAFNRAAWTGVGSLNQTVFTAASAGTIKGLQAFNAFSSAPAQGVNYVFDPGTTSKDLGGNVIPFGQPLSAGAYQTPRTFRFNFGLRF